MALKLEGRVVNLRGLAPGWEQDARYQYIGRRGHGFDGLFGNPVIIGRRCPFCGEVHVDGGSTLRCYRVYLERRVADEPEFRAAVEALDRKILVCFCSGRQGLTTAPPHICHGQILLTMVERLNAR